MFDPLSGRGTASRTGRAGEYLAAHFFERKGFTATLASAVGFDLVIAKQGKVFLVEVKARLKTKVGRPNQMRFKLTHDQIEADAFCFVNLREQLMLFRTRDDIRHRTQVTFLTKDFTEKNMHDSFAEIFGDE
jgi:Holliday junction resolvase-like predicted endonuclease